MNTNSETEFDKVLRHARGVSNLADKLGLPQGVVSGWKTRGVSQGGALAIEAAYPRKFKALKLVGVTAAKCFERSAPVKTKKTAARRARA